MRLMEPNLLCGLRVVLLWPCSLYGRGLELSLISSGMQKICLRKDDKHFYWHVFVRDRSVEEHRKAQRKAESVNCCEESNLVTRKVSLSIVIPLPLCVSVCLRLTSHTLKRNILFSG